MDFENINFEEITQRAGGAVASIFLISMADKELAKMTTKDATGKETVSPLFEYRNYAYAVIGAVLPALFAPTKDKEAFSTKYAEGIQAFGNSMLFYGASQILEKQIPDYVDIDYSGKGIKGMPEKFGSYVMGADASTEYAMQNYVNGIPAVDGETMLIQRSTGEQVYIDQDGNFVKPVMSEQLERPAPPRVMESPQDSYTMKC